MEGGGRPDIQEDIERILSEFDNFLDNVFESSTSRCCSEATEPSKQGEQGSVSKTLSVADPTPGDEERERVRNFKSAKAFFSKSSLGEPDAEEPLQRTKKWDESRLTSKNNEMMVKAELQYVLTTGDTSSKTAESQPMSHLASKQKENRDLMDATERTTVLSLESAAKPNVAISFNDDKESDLMKFSKAEGRKSTTNGVETETSVKVIRSVSLPRKRVVEEKPVRTAEKKENVISTEWNEKAEFKSKNEERRVRNDQNNQTSGVATHSKEKTDRSFFTKSLEKLNLIGKGKEKHAIINYNGKDFISEGESKPIPVSVPGGSTWGATEAVESCKSTLKKVKRYENIQNEEMCDKISALQKLLCNSSNKFSDMDKAKSGKSVQKLSKEHISQPILTSTTFNLQTQVTAETRSSTTASQMGCCTSPSRPQFEFHGKSSELGIESKKVMLDLSDPHDEYFRTKHNDMSSRLKRMDREHFSVDNSQLLKFDVLIKEFNVTKPRSETLPTADSDPSPKQIPSNDSKTRILFTSKAGEGHTLNNEGSNSRSQVDSLSSTGVNIRTLATGKNVNMTKDLKSGNVNKDSKNANVNKNFKNVNVNKKSKDSDDDKDLKKANVGKDSKNINVNKDLKEATSRSSKLKSLWLSASPTPYASIFNNEAMEVKSKNKISFSKLPLSVDEDEEEVLKSQEEEKLLIHLHNLLSTHSSKIAAGIMSVEHRGTKALELWTRRATEGYPGVNISNMTTSWRDGIAFCALIHHFRPDLVDIKSLKSENILENNALAFRVAEQHLGIPALLDAEDMVQTEVPDRLSILTYVSQFYQAFSALGLIGPGGRRSPVATNNIKNTDATSTPPSKTSPVVASPKTKSISQPPPTLQTKTEQAGFKTDKVTAVSRGRREECVACHKTVFLAERIVVGFPAQLRHRTCFRCDRCSTQLTLASYYETEKGQFCCETCPDEERPVSSGEEEETAEDVSRLSGRSERDYYYSHSDSQTDSDSAAASQSEEDSSPAPSALPKATNRSRSSTPPHLPNPRTIFLHTTLEPSQSSPPSKPPRSGTQLTYSTHFSRISPVLCGSDPFSPTETFQISDSSGPIRCDDSKGQETLPPDNALDTGQETHEISSATIQSRLAMFENPSAQKVPPKTPENERELDQPQERESIRENKFIQLQKMFETRTPEVSIQILETEPSSDIFNSKSTKRASTRDNNENVLPVEKDRIVDKPPPVYLKESEPILVFTSSNSFKSSLQTRQPENIMPETNEPPISDTKYTEDKEAFNPNTPSQNVLKGEDNFVHATASEGKASELDEKDSEKVDDETKRRQDVEVTIDEEAKEPREKVQRNEVQKDDYVQEDVRKIERKEVNVQKIKNEEDKKIEKEDDVKIIKVDYNVKEIKTDKNVGVEEREIEGIVIMEEEVTESKLKKDPKETGKETQETMKDELKFSRKEADVEEKIKSKQGKELECENAHEVIDAVTKSKREACERIKDNEKVRIEDHKEDEDLTNFNYPDELNPFGSDEEEEPKTTLDVLKGVSSPHVAVTAKGTPSPLREAEDNKKVIKAPANPFDIDDEDEEEPSQELKTTTENKVKSLNPFWSEDEESDTSSASSPTKGKVKPPRPPPPTLKKDVVVMKKKLILPSNPCDFISKPTPPSPTPSARSSSSDQSTLRFKKKLRQAPAPPSAGSSPSRMRETLKGDAPLAMGHHNLAKEGEIKDDALTVKMQKDLKNHTNKMMLKKGVPVPKSETGEWRRKKGPAPSRPVPQKRAIRKLPMRQVQQELHDIEVKQTELERQGVLLETAIRDRTERGITPSASDESVSIHSLSNNSEGDKSCSSFTSSSSSCYPCIEVEDMILQLFELVNEKNELFRRQTELMYLKREKRLEEEYAELEYQIRCLMLKPPSERSEADVKQEEHLIGRLVKIVEQRDAVVNCLEMERQREAIENESIATHMIKYQEKHIEGIESDEGKEVGKKKKKKLRLLKKKKKKGKEKEKSSKIDADKDVDETEVKKKKKNWFKKPV